jgi:HD-GYP domain-containing protein (c-di-GMP phosphodiesterase class II)
MVASLLVAVADKVGIVMSLFSQTNEFALSTIASSTDKREVIAADNIVDAESGVMLWAKGKPVNSQLQQKLLKRKLTQPIEMSLQVKDGIEGEKISRTAEQLIGQHEPLSILSGRNVSSILATLARTELAAPVQLLMTSAADRNDGTFEHAVAVCITCTALAIRGGWPESSVETVALAGLIHDLGEMYINPEYLQAKRELTPQEWLHVVAHPKVGAMLLQEMTPYPPQVTEMVLSHHERMDGTGYPRQLAGKHFIREAQLLSMAETITGILTRRDNALCRAAFALKIILREYDPNLVGLITTLADPAACRLPDGFNLAQAMEHLHGQAEQLKSALQAALELCRAKLAPDAKMLAQRCFNLISKLYASLAATGALEYCHYKEDLESDEAEVLLSLDVIPAEIRWRMRSLARDIELGTRNFNEKDREPFAILEAILTQRSIKTASVEAKLDTTTGVPTSVTS